MIARILYYLSFFVIAATVVIAGVRMWRDAHHRLAALPAAVAIAPGGHLELALDHVGLRHTGVPAWRITSPVALETLEVSGAAILGRSSGATSAPVLAIFDLATGTTKFAWPLPRDERWGVPPPAVLGSCVLPITLKGDDAIVRCLDANAGTPRWTATIPGGRECSRTPLAVAGAILVPCAGWTTVIDSATGVAAVDAGGISVVQRDPPLLLRAGSPLTLAAWDASHHRFAPTGIAVRGTDDLLSLSAVRYRDRLVLRATSSSEQVAIVSPLAAGLGDVYVVAATDKRLADDAPLVEQCGGTTSPRFQLIELAPKLGDHFDPNASQLRAFAFLDVESGTIAWTSKLVERASVPALCRGNHYFIPVGAALWIVDAETGKTLRVLGGELGGLTAPQVDASRLVGIGKEGAYEVAWSNLRATAVFQDARAEVEHVLGPLP